jgi:hypothetical protein
LKVSAASNDGLPQSEYVGINTLMDDALSYLTRSGGYA